MSAQRTCTRTLGDVDLPGFRQSEPDYPSFRGCMNSKQPLPLERREGGGWR
jgi:hypothetical protein